MSETYEAVILVPVSILAEAIEGASVDEEYLADVRDFVLSAADQELDDIIEQFREVARG